MSRDVEREKKESERKRKIVLSRHLGVGGCVRRDRGISPTDSDIVERKREKQERSSIVVFIVVVVSSCRVVVVVAVAALCRVVIVLVWCNSRRRSFLTYDEVDVRAPRVAAEGKEEATHVAHPTQPSTPSMAATLLSATLLDESLFSRMRVESVPSDVSNMCEKKALAALLSMFIKKFCKSVCERGD